MPCKQDNIFYLVDGELTPAEAALVRKHIRSCAACKVLWDDLRPVVKSFEKMSVPKLEPCEVLLVRQRAMAKGGHEPGSRESSRRMQAKAAQSKRRRKSRVLWRGVWIAAMVAASSAIAFAAGAFAARRLMDAPRVHDAAALAGAKIPQSRSAASGGEGGQQRGGHEGALLESTDDLGVSQVAPRRGLAARPPSALVVDRVAPSGARIIWSYETLPHQASPPSAGTPNTTLSGRMEHGTVAR
jgi:anti-sigma factor RsiW